MKVKLLNNWLYKRAFNNYSIFCVYGKMFPYAKRKFIQIGFFGFILSIHYGKY